MASPGDKFFWSQILRHQTFAQHNFAQANPVGHPVGRVVFRLRPGETQLRRAEHLWPAERR